MSEAKTKVQDPLPFDKLEELAAQTDRYDVRLFRRNSRGQFIALGKFGISSSELLEIDMWVKSVAGGGKYSVRLYSPENPATTVIPAFEFEIDGMPKTVQARDMMTGLPSVDMQPQMQQMGAPAFAVPPGVVMPQRSMSWAGDMPQAAQQLMMGKPNAPISSFSSDQVAMQQLEATHAELEKERKLREEDRKSADAKIDKLTKMIEEEREDRRQREFKSLQEMQKKELEAITARIEAKMQPQKPAFDAMGLASIAAALAPVFKAFVDSGSARESVALERQSQMMNMQMQGLQTMTTAVLGKGNGNQGFMEILKVAGPIAAPMLKEWWESKSPKAQADLVATMAENQLTTISMMLNMARDAAAQSSEGAPPWWMPMFESVARSIQTVTEGVGKTAKETAGVQQPAPQQRLPQQQHAPQQAQTVPPNGHATQGEQIAAAVMQDPNMPNDFRTQEWYDILAALHNKAPAELVGKAIADLVRELDDKNALPVVLTSIWENPHAALSAILNSLPIGRADTAYAKEVINATYNVLKEEPEATQHLVAPMREMLARKGVVEAVQAAVPSNHVAGATNGTPAKVEIPFDLGENKQTLNDVLQPAKSREIVPA